MSRASRAGNDDLDSRRLGALCKGEQAIRGAMRGDNVLVAGNSERVQGFGGMAHRFPVRLASHDDGDGRGHAVSIPSGIQKHRPDYKIGPWFGKAWQGVGNGLSCLGESRQAFLEHDNENWMPFSVNDDAEKDTEGSDWRAHEEENRGGERRAASRPTGKTAAAETTPIACGQ